MERAAATGISVLPVVRTADGLAIGCCGLIVGRSSIDEPEIAYELFREHHGHGYATEAARAVVAAATDTGRSRLWSTVGAWNAPSLRVLEKLGFERDHTTEEANGSVVWLTLSLRPASRG
jgi:RimJ/RimL family protein N-acetyltransferase